VLTAGLELECEYKDGSCKVHAQGLLSKLTIGESFTISGSQKEKKDTSHATFWSIGRVAHLPTEISQAFPKLVKLSIEWSKIPLLKKDLFKPAFKKIRELLLSNNGIQLIEQEAFKHLTKLTVLKLDHNQIKSLDQKLFQHNLKLEEIDLSHNSLSQVELKTFDDLTRLKAVNLKKLHRGECIHEKRDCPGCEATFNHSELNSRYLQITDEITPGLQTCDENYGRKLYWIEEGEFS
jgi:Leucine-rich repeat (LRR) protein